MNAEQALDWFEVQADNNSDPSVRVAASDVVAAIECYRRAVADSAPWTIGYVRDR